MQQKLKIAHITNRYTPDQDDEARIIKTMMLEQIDDRNNCVLICLNFKKEEYEQKEPFFIYSVPTLFTFIYRNNVIAMPWRPAAHLNSILSKFKPDIIHIHHPFLLGHHAVAWAQKHHIPTIFTFHTLYYIYAYHTHIPQFLISGLLKKSMQQVLSKATSVTGFTIHLKSTIQNEHLAIDPDLIPMPLAYDVRNQAEPLCKKFRHGPLRLISVSLWRPEKNLELLIDALNYLDVGAELHFVGYGYWKSALQEYAKIFRFPVMKKIVWHESIRRNDLKQLYQTSDLFLFSSINEAHPGMILEAMIHKLPVISWEGYVQSTIIKNRYNGFLVPHAQSMAARIEEIMVNEKLFLNLQTGAYQTAQAYDNETIAQKLIYHYYDTLYMYKTNK